MPKLTSNKLILSVYYGTHGMQDGYRALLDSSGCIVKEIKDLTESWAEILVKRLDMYRSLKDQTVTSFSQAHFDKWDRAYSFFVGLFASGELRGARFLAHKSDRLENEPHKC